MPLIKGGGNAAKAAPKDAGVAAHLEALKSADADARWNAARALAGQAGAVPALADALASETSPRVREAIMTALMRVGNEASVKAMLPCLRADDAGVRGAAIEALQSMPDVVAPFLQFLFGDSDSDVRLLATELARNMPEAEATRLLCGLIENEQHPNVCAAAIDVLTEVGTRDAIPAIEKCAARFSTTPFLPFAAKMAIARISGTEA